jgi:hypothetical protein
MLAGRHWFTRSVSKIPERRLVAPSPIDSQGMTVLLRAFLVPPQETHNAALAEYLGRAALG